VFQTQKRIKNKLVDDFDYVISFGYRYIISEDIIGRVKNPIINLHISLLPYNRGADPNFWSFYENTPKGVSIHILDKGVDTGPLLIQKEIVFAEHEDNLELTYNRLVSEIQNLFVRNWEGLLNGDITPRNQEGVGSHHNPEDFKFNLPNGWKTKIKDIPELLPQEET
jgi:methionyl-tRNA formyltransferase